MLAERGANEGVGLGDGARVIAGTVLVPPRFWLPDSLGSFDLPEDVVSPGWAWVALTGWFVLVVAAAATAWRRGLRELAGLGLIAAVTLVGAVVAAARIPLSLFGFIPQNYFWMWPTGVFLTVAVAAGLLALIGPGRRVLASTSGLVGLVACGVVVAVVAAQPVDYFASVPSVETAGERVARPAVEQLATGLRRHAVTGPVVVDYSRASFGNYLRYVFLAELQRAGIEFTFPPEDENINRFGRRRCDDGDAVTRIVLADSGGDPVARPGESVLAHVDEFSPDEQRELVELDRRFGDTLRDGTIELDLGGARVPERRGARSSLGAVDAGPTCHRAGLDRRLLEVVGCQRHVGRPAPRPGPLGRPPDSGGRGGRHDPAGSAIRSTGSSRSPPSLA